MRPVALLLLPLVGCKADYQLAEASARVLVSPELADAGVVAVGESAPVDVSVVHADGGSVRVLAVEIVPLDGDAFSAPEEPYPEVAVGTTETLSIAFVPASEGYYRSRLTIRTDEDRESEHVVLLRGQAADAAAEILPGLAEFGAVAAGATGSATVSLMNDGPVPLSLDALTFDDDRFSSILLLPATVGVGDEVAVPLSFRADDAQEATGTLTFDTTPALGLSAMLRANACATAGGALYDTDGDGFGACGPDCDDTDPDVNPVGTEICDGIDEDCDGAVDEDTPCSDDDGDGAAETDGDCNDGDAAVGPSVAEVQGNGVDDDCDGSVDGGSTDADGDGYDPAGGDCDDADATVFPGAAEEADGVDDNCDGVADEGTAAYDDDGDGVSEDDGDCDDTTVATLPGAAEIPDWMDNDCDGAVDEGTTNADDDGDGVSERGGDCDDADASAHAGAAEIPGDGIDNDCDGTVE